MRFFNEKWIGRGGPVAWPPRSPDLTSPDYFLWSFVQEQVMAVAPTTPDDMKEIIRRACTEITPQMLAEVRQVEGPLKVIIPVCFDFSTIFILCVTRMTLCCSLS